jgi:hypothetical protein
MTPKQERLIAQYNENPSTIEKIYNKDRGEMLQYFIQKDLLDYLDEEIFEDYLDLILYEKLNNASPENKMGVAAGIADKYLSDITFEYGKVYYDADLNDVDQIFYDGRGIGLRWIVNKILGVEGDDNWEPFQDVVDEYSFYDDCIETLTNENKMLLSNKLNDELSNVKVSSDTELLEEIAEEQGHEDYVELSTDLIYNRILDDKQSTKFLLLNQTNLGYDLMWRYNDAYNQVTVDDYYRQVMDGIQSFFNSSTHGERFTSKYISQYTNKEVFSEKFRIDITNSFYDFLMKYFSNWKDNTRYNENIDYHGSYTQLIKMLIDWGELDTEKISEDHYPYSRDVEKLYNEIIVGDVI